MAYIPGPIFNTGINIQTTSYTFVLADQLYYVRMGSATAQTITVPTNASVAFPIGTELSFEQSGTGQLTVVAASGVIINTFSTNLTKGQFATASLKKTGTDTWTLTGNLQ